MPNMKVVSMNFVKESDIPEQLRNSEVSRQTQAIKAMLEKAGPGQGVSVEVSGAKKWHRYSLQARLRKAGCRCDVVLEGNRMLIKKIAKPVGEKK